MSTARAVYDAAADTYVQFAGADIGSATEHAVDRSLLEGVHRAGREASGQARCRCRLRTGPGDVAPGRSWARRARRRRVAGHAHHRSCRPSAHRLRGGSTRCASHRIGGARRRGLLVLDHPHTSASARRHVRRAGEGPDPRRTTPTGLPGGRRATPPRRCVRLRTTAHQLPARCRRCHRSPGGIWVQDLHHGGPGLPSWRTRPPRRASFSPVGRSADH